MKHQLHNRLCAPLIQDVMTRFCNKTLRASQACEIIGVSTSRLYTLRTEYLQAKAEGTLHEWQPGNSGGDHIPALPPKADACLRQMLNERFNFAFASSELSRRFNIEYSRWSVRRFALAEGFAQKERHVPIPAHTRRWQRLHIGELWQLDASPHPWFGPEHPAQPLFDMIDDASRLQVGIRLCGSETVAQYIYFFEKTFGMYGLPLEIYVDNATFFRSPVEGNLTGLGWRLAFYGVSLRFAGTPQAKGKVERIHQVWQDRLPGFFRLNGLGWESDLGDVNETLEALATHRNTREKHRELGTTPRAAWDALRARGQDKLRPVPCDAWWPYVWSVWINKRVGKGGRVHHGDLFFPTRLKEGEHVILCDHGGGHFSVINSLPKRPDVLPVVLFTNRPKNAL